LQHVAAIVFGEYLPGELRDTLVSFPGVRRESGVQRECALIGEQPGRHKFDGKAILFHEFLGHRRCAVAPAAQRIEEIGKVNCLGHGCQFSVWRVAVDPATGTGIWDRIVNRSKRFSIRQ
jgi:hypothetical protein